MTHISKAISINSFWELWRCKNFSWQYLVDSNNYKLSTRKVKKSRLLQTNRHERQYINDSKFKVCYFRLRTPQIPLTILTQIVGKI